MAVLTDELNLPRDTTVDEIAKDATLQDTNTALSLLAKDTTLSAINTALGALAKDTSVQGITTAMSAINTALAALASLAKDTTLQATNTALGSLAKDTSLQAVGTALADVATDTTLGATNTALGSLAKDTSLQAVNTALGSLATDLTLGATNTALGNVITELQAIATAISQSGGSSDYEQLSNRPQINSTTLSGNKTGSALGLSDAADISSLVLSGTTNTTGQSIASGTYFYLNGDLVKAIAAIANGATFTLNTNYEIVTVGSELSTLNSAIANIPILKSYDYDTGSVQLTRDSLTDMYYGTVNIEAPADASYAVGVCWANTSWNACAIGVVSNPYIADNKKMFMVWFASSKSMTIPSRRIRLWYI